VLLGSAVYRFAEMLSDSGILSDSGATGPPARPYQVLVGSKLTPAAPQIEAESESAQAKAIDIRLGVSRNVRFMVLSTG
jgi:hypothetical protein